MALRFKASVTAAERVALTANAASERQLAFNDAQANAGVLRGGFQSGFLQPTPTAARSALRGAQEEYNRHSGLSRTVKRATRGIGRVVKSDFVKYTFGAPVAVPHRLSKEIAKAGSKVPGFDKIIKAGAGAVDPLSALKPHKALKRNVAAVKQGAPLIAVAAGVGGATALTQGLLSTGSSLLGGGGYSTPPTVEPVQVAAPSNTALYLLAGAGILVTLLVRR